MPDEPRREIVLRFYGRFVIADFGGEETKGKLAILALNLSFNREVNATPHRLLLAAPRRAIANTTTIPADTVIMQPTLPPDLAELALWELTDKRVTPRNKGGFTWGMPPTEPNAEGTTLADLARLSPTARFDPAHTRQFGAKLPVAAIFDIEAGVGTLNVVDPAPLRFEPLAGAGIGTGTGRFTLRLAEVVDVTIGLPAPEQLVLDVTSADGTTGVLAFITDPLDRTMITISNLCALSQTAIDEEFAAAYDVLKMPPRVPDRPVPVTGPTEGHRFSCFKEAYVKVGD